MAANGLIYVDGDDVELANGLVPVLVPNKPLPPVVVGFPNKLVLVLVPVPVPVPNM